MTGSTDIETAREIASREMTPYSGQRRLGTLFQVGKAVMAFDLDERHVGTFPKVQDATRLLANVCTA